MSIKVLFICLGNICRSPTAEGVFQHLIENNDLQSKISCDSAGCHSYHAGEPPDIRSTKIALKRGYDLSTQKSRQVTQEDFTNFDYIIAMDRDNLRHLRSIEPTSSTARIELFLEAYGDNANYKEVPDPYYGGGKSFDLVLDLIEEASIGLLDEIRAVYEI